MRVSLLTATGGRLAAWGLCERWIARQTMPPDEWIVVDDCEPAQPCTMGQTVIRPEPLWQPEQVTQHRNLLAGLERVTGDLVIVIEDDDWYSPRYLETMVSVAESTPDRALFGEGQARYYHVGNRRYCEHHNREHASLCATAFRAGLVSVFSRICRAGPQLIDIALWRVASDRARMLRQQGLVVGIKGMPGRPGIGAGHKLRLGWPVDEDGAVLRRWVGDDAAVYAEFVLEGSNERPND